MGYFIGNVWGWMVGNGCMFFGLADEKNALAARCLIRLNEKLNGRDDNDTTATENQVERLIRQAMSPWNLSQMFAGWQPYL